MQYGCCYGNYRGKHENLKTKCKMTESRFALSDEIVVDQMQLNAKNKHY